MRHRRPPRHHAGTDSAPLDRRKARVKVILDRDHIQDRHSQAAKCAFSAPISLCGSLVRRPDRNAPPAPVACTPLVPRRRWCGRVVPAWPKPPRSRPARSADCPLDVASRGNYPFKSAYLGITRAYRVAPGGCPVFSRPPYPRQPTLPREHKGLCAFSPILLAKSGRHFSGVRHVGTRAAHWRHGAKPRRQDRVYHGACRHERGRMTQLRAQAKGGSVARASAAAARRHPAALCL